MPGKSITVNGCMNSALSLFIVTGIASKVMYHGPERRYKKIYTFAKCPFTDNENSLRNTRGAAAPWVLRAASINLQLRELGQNAEEWLTDTSQFFTTKRIENTKPSPSFLFAHPVFSGVN